MTQVIPILVYHSVAELDNVHYCRWNVRPDIFERQMRLIASNGFKTLTVKRLLELRERNEMPPAKAVVISFDDGLRDFLTGALPILNRYAHASTLFVVAGRIGQTSTWLAPLGMGDYPMLSLDELREVHRAGVEIGAHSMNHLQLDLLDERQAHDEIAGSKLALERMVNTALWSFAYPHGYASDATRRVVREAGFKAACRVRHALSDMSENQFALSRVIVTEDMSDAELLGIMSGNLLPIAPRTETIAIKGWRAVRWAKRMWRTAA